jgi:ribonuclease P protein component
MGAPRALSTSKEFREVFSHGRRGRSDGIALWVLPRPGGGRLGLGLGVGTAVGGAVQRNRLRRRLREVIRSEHLTDTDIVITAEPSAGLLPYQQLAGHVEAALAEAGAGAS